MTEAEAVKWAADIAFKIARRNRLSVSDAEDVAADTVQRCWAKGKLDNKGYVCIVARNRVVDFCRQSDKRAALCAGAQRALPTVEEPCSRDIDAIEAMGERIRHLPTRYQGPVVLKIYGCTDQEGADLLGITVKAYKARLSRGRKAVHGLCAGVFDV